MKKLITKPYLIFWGIIPLTVFLGYFFKEESFDFNIHATYFVIYNQHLSYLISIYFLIIGLVYFTVVKIGKNLKNWMNFVHSLITILGLFILKILVTISQKEYVKPRNFYDKCDLEDYDYINLGIIILIMLIIIAQFIFLTNTILAIFSKRVKQ